jgi:hypothetical protein
VDLASGQCFPWNHMLSTFPGLPHFFQKRGQDAPKGTNHAGSRDPVQGRIRSKGWLGAGPHPMAHTNIPINGLRGEGDIYKCQ